jgi:thiamine pyrophosphokinase
MTDTIHRVLLFVNGDFPQSEKLIAQIKPEDFLMAVDGGLRHLTEQKLTPNLIIGDLDSADPDEVQRLQMKGVEVRQYPVDKDETDLELALNAALELQPDHIWVVAALGDRIDQTLGNIFLLTLPELANTDVRLVDGVREVFLIRESGTIRGIPGQRVSLLPLNGPAHGITTEGLAYPLHDETLYPERTRGISNRLTDPSARVTVETGLLLCIHERDEPFERSDG